MMPGIRWQWQYSVWLLLACALVALGYAWRATRPVQLNPESIIPDVKTGQEATTLLTVHDRPTLIRINALAADSFGDVQPMPTDRYEQFLLVNKSILCALVDGRQNALGYFDIFPLQPQFGNALLSGIAVEHDLRHEHLMPEAMARTAQVLYLGGIAVRDPETMLGMRSASQLAWGMLQYLDHHFGFDGTRKLVATAATSEGEILLRRFQFKEEVSAKDTRDGHAVYSLLLEPTVLAAGLTQIPDWSRCCRVSWSSGNRPSSQSS